MTNELVVFKEEEILPLSIYERIELAKKIRQEQENILMSRIVTFIIILNLSAIMALMITFIIKVLQNGS